MSGRGLAALALIAACSGASDDPDLDGWRAERASRNAALEAYVASHATEVEAFERGDMTTVGIPMVAFRLLPELFPEYWGAPRQGLQPLGFEPDGRALPLGLGYAPAPLPGGATINVVGPACGECHLGRVVGPDGTILRLVGAPSNRFDGSGLIRAATLLTVTSPRFSAAAFREALARKPPGWVYGDAALAEVEARERALFAQPEVSDALLAELKTRTMAVARRAALSLDAHTYAAPDAPPQRGQTGFMDLPSMLSLAMLDEATLASPDLLDAMLPRAPAVADMMGTWLMHERPAWKWDGLSEVPLYANLAVGLVSVGDPTRLNLDNARKVTRLVADLPPPPYPFDVSAPRAARGARLFEAHCASCHHPGSTEIFPPSRTGTDANRAQAWRPRALAVFLARLRVVCSADDCAGPGGQPWPDGQLFRATGGYMALPLRGLWATAPYLHNGSVPTLLQLLEPKRRMAQFYRGNLAFDEREVGFVWDRWEPGAMLVDTREQGLSNAGHDTPEYLGIDWAAQPDATADLLDYLKTL